MAEMGWMLKIVNTEGRPCPVRLEAKCPGNRQGCAWWLDEIAEQHEEVCDEQGKSTGKTRVIKVDTVSGCGVMFLYAIQLSVREEAIRTQASLDKTATVMRDAGSAIAASVLGALRAAPLRTTRVAIVKNGHEMLEPGEPS